jgi:putative endopeptidase
MRRKVTLWSIPLVALAAACGAAEPTPVTAPPVASVTPSATVAIVPTAAHAPAPPPPPGIEISSLDTAASPCDDFFQYACGGWIAKNPIPDDQGGWGRFNALAEQNEMALRDILEGDAKSPSKGDPYAKGLGEFYSSCIDEAAVEKAGTKALEPMMRRIAGVSDARGLAGALAHMNLLGSDAFFGVGSEQDFKDATQVIAAMDQGGLGMPDRDYYLKDDDKTVKVRDAYVAHVERVFILLGDKPAVAKTEAQAVFALEKELAGAQITRTEHRDPKNVYHRMNRSDLPKIAPTFAWDAYFKELGANDVKGINVYEPAYIAAIDKHLAAEPKDGWANEIRPYLRWQLERSYAKSLPKAFVDENFAFERELTGAAKILPRWKQCVRAVDNGMGEALAIPFVKVKLGAEGKQITQDMVKGIEASMQADLTTLAWMDDATRQRAIEKVHKLFNKIGYPDKWRNYDALQIEKNSYAGNVLRSNEFETKRQLAKIGKPVDRAEWGMTPPTVNAYYNPSLNEMVFPAGILQPPFYSSSAPQAVNFGGIGMVMGHELTHGFDDEGRQFDGDGNMKDWWTPTVGAEFDKRAACVANQFDGYVAVDDVHLNGKLTLGENLADLGGMKLALKTLHAKTPATPEADRQFFLGIAQVWCGARRPEVNRVRVRVDPHSPPRWRVNGPLSNTPEFAAAFSCQAGDAMVRSDEQRCTVW